MIAGQLEIQLFANLARLQKDMTQAKGMVGNATKSMESAVAGAKRALQSLGLGIGLGFAVRQILSLTDEYTKFTSQLKLATNSQQEYLQALSSVRSIAKASQADLAATGVLYARITRATGELGIGQQKVGQITEAVSLALKASGASGGEAASAMLQLSQAFGSGVLRGQEFNAVNEAAPRIMKALADGMGVPVGALRGMAEQGKITAEVMAEALPKALGELRKEAAQVQTIAGAFTVLKNEVMEFIGSSAQSSGAISLLTTAVTALANNLDLLAAAIIGITVVKLAQWVIGVTTAMHAKVAAFAASIAAANAERAATIASTAADVAREKATLQFVAVERAKTIAEMQAAQAVMRSTAAHLADTQALAANTAAKAANAAATNKLASLSVVGASATTAHKAATVAQGAAMAATGGRAMVLTRLLGFLGGPIGIITTLLGLGAAAWTMWGSKSSDAANKAAGAMRRSTASIVEDLDKQIQKLQQKIGLQKAGDTVTAKMGGPQAERAAELQAQIDAIRARGATEGRKLTPSEQLDIINIEGQKKQITERARALDDLKKQDVAMGQEKKLGAWMETYATRAEKMAVEIAKAKKELGAAFTPELEARIRAKFEPKGAGGSGSAAVAKLAREEESAALELEKQRESRRQIELGAFRDTIAQKQTLLDSAYAANEISDAQYFQSKIESAKAVADAEVAAINATIRDREAALARQVAGSKKAIDIQTEIQEAEGKRAAVTREFGFLTERVWQQAKMAAENYKRAIEDIDTELLSLTGRTEEAALKQFDRAKEGLRKKAEAEGDSETLKKIAEVRRLVGAQAGFNKARQDLSDINARLSIEEERVANSQRVGAISEMEALRKVSELRRQSVEEQERIVAGLEQVAAASRNPALQLEAEKARAALEKLRAETDLLGQKFNQIFEGAAADAFSDFMNGTKSAKEAFQSFGDSVVKQINRMVAEALSKRLFNAMGMGGGAGGGGGIGGIFGGLLGGGGGGGGLFGGLFGGGGSASLGGSLDPLDMLGSLAGGFATGTDFVPRTGLAMVHRGERITPASQNAGAGRNVTVNNVFNVSGDVNARSQAQISAAAGQGVQRALARNT